MAGAEMIHDLTLRGRQKLTMTGVSEVLSFEDTSVVLRTEMGTLVVQGSNLQLKTLSTDGGQVAVEGTVAALIYEEPRQGAGCGGCWDDGAGNCLRPVFLGLRTGRGTGHLVWLFASSAPKAHLFGGQPVRFCFAAGLDIP